MGTVKRPVTPTARDNSKAPRAECYYYLGRNALHVGQYANVIRLLENHGLTINLIAGRFVSVRRPLRAWSERKMIGTESPQDLRARIRGTFHAPFYTAFKVPTAVTAGLAMHAFSYNRKRIVVHARTAFMGVVALLIKRVNRNIRVICELEGDSVAEIEYAQLKGQMRGNVERKKRRAYSDVDRVLRDSDATLCVSRRMAEVLTVRHRLSETDQAKIVVFPSSASRSQFFFDEADRVSFRKRIGVGDRFVVLYLGNLLAPWQLPDKIVEVFARIREVHRDSLLLILSQREDFQFVVSRLRRAGIADRDYIAMSVPHSEVSGYVSAADVGLMLREPHLMNEVASPGKFCEYVMAGLPIIMTAAIGEYSQQMIGCEFVAVIDDLSSAESIDFAVRQLCTQRFTSEQRAAFSSWAADKFAIENYVPQIARLYETI